MDTHISQKHNTSTLKSIVLRIITLLSNYLSAFTRILNRRNMCRFEVCIYGHNMDIWVALYEHLKVVGYME